MAAILEPPSVVAGYSFDRSPDLTDAKVREQLSGSAIKAFMKIVAEWISPKPKRAASGRHRIVYFPCLEE